MSLKRRLDKLENIQNPTENKTMAVIEIEEGLDHSAVDKNITYTEEELKELERNNTFILRAKWAD